MALGRAGAAFRASPTPPGRRARPRPRAARPRRPRSRARGAPARAADPARRRAALASAFAFGLGFGLGFDRGGGLPARGRPGLALLDAPAGTRASRRRSCAACRSSNATVRVPTASSSARSWDTSSSEPGNSPSASSSASRLSRSRWLVGSSRISTLAPDWTRIASDSRRRSPPDSPSSGFSASSPENRKRPSSARALPGVSPVACWAASSTVRAVPGDELVGVLGQIADLDVVPGAELAAESSSRAPGERLDQRRLAGPVGADQRHVLAALQPQLGVVEQRLAADRDRRRRSSSNTTRPLRSGGLNANCSAAPSAGSRADPIDLVELLGARLRLPRAGAGPEPGDEPLEPLDLGLLALDRAAQRQLARRLLLAPRRATARRRTARAQPRAPAPRCRPPPGTSGRGRPARSPRRARPGAARATPATRCRGGWSARRAAAGRGRRPAPGPATRASARRRRTCAASGRGRRRRGTRARAGSPARGRASRSRRRARAAPGPRRSGSASPRRGRRRPSPARARPARCSIATSSRAPDRT